MRIIDFKKEMEFHANKIREFIESGMPSKGDKEEDCQRLCLLNRLSKFEHCVNGMTQRDLKEG